MDVALGCHDPPDYRFAGGLGGALLRRKVDLLTLA
jgi:hypothetical protein